MRSLGFIMLAIFAFVGWATFWISRITDEHGSELSDVGVLLIVLAPLILVAIMMIVLGGGQ